MAVNKRNLHHWLKITRELKIWQLVVILLIMIFLTATLLRLNNLIMLDKRAAVLAADKVGDEAKTKTALLDLQHYVSAHMNTSLNQGVYLEDSYARDRQAAIEKVSQTTTNPNSKVYKQASLDCRSRFVGGVESFRDDYVQCVLDRVASLSAADDSIKPLALPDVNLYRHDFVSPIWSPDLAGFSLLVTLLLSLIIVIKIGFEIIARLLLKKQYKRVYS